MRKYYLNHVWILAHAKCIPEQVAVSARLWFGKSLSVPFSNEEFSESISLGTAIILLGAKKGQLNVLGVFSIADSHKSTTQNLKKTVNINWYSLFIVRFLLHF